MRLRLTPPLALAVAAAFAVSAPPPAAHAGDGDLGKATRYATSVEIHAQAAARFAGQVGRPDYLAFGNTANAIAAEAHQIEVKLAVGDVAGAKACVRHLKGLIKSLDKQEDRLSRFGFGGRDARKTADDFADEIEDAFDDLEDEVEDLKFVPVVVHGGAPHSAIVGGPPVVRGLVRIAPQPYSSAPRWNGAPNAPGPSVGVPPGYEYQGEGDRGGVYYGPSRGLSDPGASLGRPSSSADGLYDLRVTPQPSRSGDLEYRPVPSRDAYRPVPNRAPLPQRYEEPADEQFDGPALPGLSPQTRFEGYERGRRIYSVSLR